MYDRSPHMHDPRTTLDFIVWHKDEKLEKLVCNIIELAKPTCWVETGTMLGWSCMWIAERYPDLPIYTVELDNDFYTRALQNLAPYKNIHLSHDHSVNWLWKMLPDLRNARPAFFLDAHLHPPHPLKEEARIVAELDRYVCLVDDFKCWSPDWNGDTLFSRPSLDYTKSGVEGGGDPYHCDLSYVLTELGATDHFRPTYEPQPGNNGVGLWVKGFDYVPPSTWRSETTEQFLASRPASAYPLHPSFSVVMP